MSISRDSYMDQMSGVCICPTCEMEIKDNEFEKIVWQGKSYFVCPECLAELINTEYRELTYEELREKRKLEAIDD